jgi:hypothetical protein
MAKSANTEPRVVLESVRNAKLWSDGTISLFCVRASYPHVLEKFAGKKGETPKHSIVVLIPKRKKWNAAYELVQKRIAELMKENKQKKLRSEHKFLRDGDDAGKEEYEGFWTVNASEANMVDVRDNKRDPKTGKARILEKGKDDDVIFAGSWVNVVIRPWFMNNEHGKKVNAGLIAVQHVPIEKVREQWKAASDDPFGTGRISKEEVDEDFDDYTDDDDGDDDYDDDDDD